ncbi:hypothetical protein CSHISOI_08770 [Colletotrichum shisoi]|uniref:Isochorismatase-like domain-containing protein n=1 Tax=Colletotrichum shisoi TaxID=2078593 RepID=A0A5Q4BI03_9PEZI|nr:hypothetical protein CSHISOI_08770 [Colletotrichum shisoi]
MAASSSIFALEKTAVVLIDPYNDFLHPEGKLFPAVQESPHSYGHRRPPQDTRGGGPKPSDVIYKTLTGPAAFALISGFANTDKRLDYIAVRLAALLPSDWHHYCRREGIQLRQRGGFSNLVLAGMTANTCYESTARYAREL